METLILLHGAAGAASQLAPLANSLAGTCTTHSLNFTGHGGRPGTAAPFSISLFAGDVLQYMDDHGIEKASVFGYSMGGYVAMYLAKHNPERINKVITLATKYHWDEAIAEKEARMLNSEKIEQKVPAFADSLRNMHAPGDWKLLLQKTAYMLTALGADNTLKPGDYAQIAAPSLILLGDRDKMVTADETFAIYKALPHAQLCIMPGAPHPIEQVDVRLLSFLIKSYLG